MGILDKINVYIDAENFQRPLDKNVIEQISAHGTISRIYAYADWSRYMALGQKILAENNARFRQCFHTGKNDVDLAIIEDVLHDAAVCADVKTFCIVSNDHIYANLKLSLRANDKKLMVVGAYKTAYSLIDASDIFIRATPDETPIILCERSVDDLAGLQGLFEDIYDEVEQHNKIVLLAEFGQVFSRYDTKAIYAKFGVTRLASLIRLVPTLYIPAQVTARQRVLKIKESERMYL